VTKILRNGLTKLSRCNGYQLDDEYHSFYLSVGYGSSVHYLTPVDKQSSLLIYVGLKCVNKMSLLCDPLTSTDLSSF